MAKRQIRYESSQLSELVGNQRMYNFILKNDAVYFATPLSLKSDVLKVKNSKGHILDLPITQIEEIWGEEKAIYS